MDPSRVERFFGEAASIADRFPDVKGSLRWKLILEVYALAVQDARASSSMHLFTPSGARALRRALINDRRQLVVIKQYVEMFLENGCMEAFRGGLIAVGSAEGSVLDLIAGATLVEATSICNSTSTVRVPEYWY